MTWPNAYRLRLASGDLALPEVSPPFAVEVELRSELSAEAIRQIAEHDELLVVGDRTVAFTCERMAGAYVWAASVQILAAGKRLRDGEPRDYLDWHDDYERPGSHLHRRLQIVIRLIRRALHELLPGTGSLS